MVKGHVWLWDFNHKEGRAPKNGCLQTAVLERTPESRLDSKEIKPVSLKGNQPWTLIGRTDAEAEVPVFGSIIWCKQPTHWKSPSCWERLRAEGKEGIRGRGGWMASPMQWTWTWANSRRWWWTGMLWSVGSQKSQRWLTLSLYGSGAAGQQTYVLGLSEELPTVDLTGVKKKEFAEGCGSLSCTYEP